MPELLPRAARPGSTLLGSEVLTVAALVTYDTIGRGQVKLPRPGPPLSALGFYSLLALAGSLSAGAGRVAAAVGAVVALTTLVAGARGKGLLQLIRRLTGQVASNPPNG